MRKTFLLFLFLLSALFISCIRTKENKEINTEQQTALGEIPNEYDGAAERERFEFEQIKDPALGYIPMDRMMKAVEYTEKLKTYRRTNRITGALSWTERGPIYDFVGQSGNPRGGVANYTSGRTRAILIDTLNDPTGNTVFCGGVAGGLWRCTDFLAAVPNWQHIDDRFDNLAISSIAQDPSNKLILFFATGEANGNIDAVYGGGIWKSTNGGATWRRLTSETTQKFLKVFKLVCDGAGNVYVANSVTTFGPSSNANGVWRSNDGGTNWQNITPAVTTSTNAICTDIEISSTGRLHASFGYTSSSIAALKVQHQYTDIPATVTSVAGWVPSVGIRIDNTVPANRLELAVSGNVLYGVTTNSTNNVDSCYKSVDGGATWALQNAAAYTDTLSKMQGWYCITLAMNPANTSEIVVGGVDAFKSTNNGATIARLTYWVTNVPYVHADHQFMQWWKAGAQSRIVIGCDGGVFLSNDGGANFVDKNRNLAIKQFYSCAIHPADGSNYFLAGAQDNGVHQLTNPGLSFSTEVTGGDGSFVHINQQDPQIQFGSYVRNQYSRSTNGGLAWSFIDLSDANGLFINPFDYDDAQNIMYASWGASIANNQIVRWNDANASGNTTVLTLNALARGGNNGNATTFKVSPYTQDIVFVGSSSGKLIRLDNASSVTQANADANVTDLTASAFPEKANLSCINTGSSDSKLVAVFSNYGVPHVWVSNDGGGTWANIDGDMPGSKLPDMPVRWAVFDPQNDNKIFLATEAGVYYTDSVSGGTTVWTSDPGFPTVRTDMLQIRVSDNTLLAATHGRGLWTAPIPATPAITFNVSYLTCTEASAAVNGCRGYKDYTINVSILAPPTGDAFVDYWAQGSAMQYWDYDFTTNGDFASPSRRDVFLSGVKDPKLVTVRIYDDAEVEATEEFTLGFTIYGSTNAVLGQHPLCRFKILDNDFPPSPNAMVNGSIGTPNISLSQPFQNQYMDSRTQVIYLASELKAAGFSAGFINSVFLNVTEKNSTAPFNDFTIKMKNTKTGVMQLGGAFEAGTTVVYGPVNYNTVAGNNSFALATPFEWDGTSNLLIQYCYHNTAKNQSDNVAGTSGNALCQFDTVNNSIGCSLPYAKYRFKPVVARPDIAIAMTVATPVATKVNSAKILPLTPKSNLYFYTPKREVIARIYNASVHDFGCTSVNIDREGTGAEAFLDNVPKHFLLSKTYVVTPTLGNANAAYEITLYFTAAEKAGWEAATGNSWNNIKIIKTIGTITNAPANSNEPGAVQIVAPVFGKLGPDFTLTGTFFNGFSYVGYSGFGAGIPGAGTGPLPVTLLKFEGQLNNQTALLNWSTSSEQNSKNFDIEKSTDGTNFYKIGLVNAAGNSSSRKNYMFRDAQLSDYNYYRLRLNDVNGNNKLSNVVLINYSSAVQKVWVVNNPFFDFIAIRFAKQPAKISLQLLNANGAVVAEKQMMNVSGEVLWFLPMHLSAGTYILRSVVDEKVFTNKLIKQ